MITGMEQVEGLKREWVQDQRPAWETVGEFEQRVERALQPTAIDVVELRVDDLIDRQLLLADHEAFIQREREAARQEWERDRARLKQRFKDASK